MSLDEDGNLVLCLPGGRLLQHAPVIYQRRERAAGEYRLLADNRVTFSVSSYDSARPPVIDPVPAFSTFLGRRQRRGT